MILSNAELAVGELDPAHPAQQSLGDLREAATGALALVGRIVALGESPDDDASRTPRGS